MKLLAVRVLAFPPFNHDMGFFAIISFHDAGNLIAVPEAAATDGAGRFLPGTSFFIMTVVIIKSNPETIKQICFRLN